MDGCIIARRPHVLTNPSQTAPSIWWTADETQVEIFRAAAGTLLLDHTHPEPHLLVVVEGGILDQGCEYASGDVRLSPANDRHFVRFSRASTCLLFHRRCAFLNAPLLQRWRMYVPTIQALGQDLVAMASRDRAERGTHLVQRIVKCVSDVYERSLNLPPAWLHELHRHICLEAEEVSPVSKLARQAGVTREHLSRSFRKHYQVQICAFLQQRRIEKAYRQIRATKNALAAIAFDSGFADQSHMTREFVNAFGLTPGKVRADAGVLNPSRYG